MKKRVNIVLPESRLKVIDRTVKRGMRSSFINQAVKYYVQTRGTEALRNQLEFAVTRSRYRYGNV